MSFPLWISLPRVLPTASGIAEDIEDVVLNLERGAQTIAVGFQFFNRLGIRAGEGGTQRAAGGTQHGCFVRDDLKIRFLIQVEIVAIVDLQQFAFANLVGGVGDQSAGKLRFQAGAKMVAVADEIITQQHGGFIAAQVIDDVAPLRRSSASSSTSSCTSVAMCTISTTVARVMWASLQFNTGIGCAGLYR